ncbi:MAG: Outer rane lipoprotein [Nitrospirae bacterium]|jgi:TolA-binding protein|nr:Outer rane lipoprotein [Nitrospirota bacterium]
MEMKKSTWRKGVILSILALLLTSPLMAEENPYDKAVRAYMKKDFRTAVKYLKEYVAQKPDAQAYYLLGYALYKQKRHAESAKYFEEAYILDPNISPVITK